MERSLMLKEDPRTLPVKSDNQGVQARDFRESMALVSQYDFLGGFDLEGLRAAVPAQRAPAACAGRPRAVDAAHRRHGRLEELIDGAGVLRSGCREV